MDQYIKKLKELARNLSSSSNDSPEVIKKQMEELGLKYSDDEIERLNEVLLALHPLSKKIKEERPNNIHEEMTH